MQSFLWILLFGASGVALRYGVGLCFAWSVWPSYWATALVNGVGSLLAGFLVCVYSERAEVSPLLLNLRPYFFTGFLGGFTTFSAMSVEMLNGALSGQWGFALAYGVGHLIFGFLATGLGYWLATIITA